MKMKFSFLSVKDFLEFNQWFQLTFYKQVRVLANNITCIQIGAINYLLANLIMDIESNNGCGIFNETY